MSSSYGDIVAEETAFLMCDIQMKLIMAMQHFDDISTVAERMVSVWGLSYFYVVDLSIWSVQVIDFER